MKHLLTSILILFLFSCLPPQNELNREIDTVKTKHIEQIDSAKYLVNKGALTGKVRLDLYYGAISCPCAQWFEAKNADIEGNLKEHFYLEPANASLIHADTLYKGQFFPVRILVTGRFYSSNGYPKNYFPTKGHPEPARVFRYEKIRIIQRGTTIGKKNGL